MTEIKKKTNKDRVLTSNIISEIYFSSGQPATAVSAGLMTLIDNTECSHTGAWVADLNKDHHIRTEDGAFGWKHVSAMFDALDETYSFGRHTEAGMIMVIAIRGLYSNLVWQLCEGRGDYTRFDVVRIMAQALETVTREPELVFGCDPFSENRPA